MSDSWPNRPLETVALVDRGISWSADQERPVPGDDTVPVVRIGNLKRDRFEMTDRLFLVSVGAKDRERKAITSSTILVVGSNGNPERIGNAYLAAADVVGHVYASFIIGIHPLDGVSPEFLWMWLQSAAVQRRITAATSGSTGLKNIGLRWFRQLWVPVPPVAVQRRIVDLVSHVDRAIDNAARVTAASTALHRVARESWFARLWGTEPAVPLGRMLQRVRRPISVDPHVMYRELGVRSHGRGIFHKPPTFGAGLGSKAVFSIEPGDLVLNIVFAWERAVAIASSDDAGRCASHRFPTYLPRDGVILEYVLEALLSERGHELMELASPGSAGRNRTLNQTALLASLVPMPSLAVQREIVAALHCMAEVSGRHEANLSALRSFRSALLQSLLSGDHEIPDGYDDLLNVPA